MVADTTNKPAASPPGPDELRRVLDGLTDPEKLLIIANAELYGGDWNLLRQDLVDRLAGRPYVITLGERIREDLDRVERLEAVERRLGVRLSDYVTLD